MIRASLTRRRPVAGLRTRYNPKSRIGQGLVSLAPWFNVMLIMLFLILFESRLVLQPGIVIDLPREPFTDGTRVGFVAVVFSVPGPDKGTREEIVFFDDERFRMASPERFEKLKQALSRRAQTGDPEALVVQADRRVPYETMVRLMDAAREAGFKQINMATRPE